MKRFLITTAALLLMFSTVLADDDDDDPPIPVGVYCLGGDVVVFNVTEHEAYLIGDGIWMQGDFDETLDSTPCDLLPGGD